MALVSNVSSTLKRHYSNTQVISPEEAIQRKSNMLHIVDVAMEKFAQNLAEGNVKLDSSLDLERLVKLTLILSGEADSITGKPTNQSEQIDSAEIPNLGSVIDGNDPTIKAMFEKLYHRYNQLNDTD